MKSQLKWYVTSFLTLSAGGILASAGFAQQEERPRDPGVRPSIDLSRVGGIGLGCPELPKAIPGLTPAQEKLFCAGAEEFAKVNTVRDDGLGPTFNFTSCQGCHIHPSSGGSSPPGRNPQYDFANKYPRGTNVVPVFVKENGPIMVARLKYKLDPSWTIGHRISRWRSSFALFDHGS